MVGPINVIWVGFHYGPGSFMWLSLLAQPIWCYSYQLSSVSHSLPPSLPMLIMESLSVCLSSSPPIQNNQKTLKSTTTSKSNTHQTHLSISKNSSLQNHLSLLKTSISLTSIQLLTSLPSLASEALAPPTGESSDKINLESIVVSIDEFFKRYPFFVGGCTFIWLIVIPLTQQYFRKYKFISTIDAFRKLRGTPEVQLLDIRISKSVMVMGSPNLKIFGKDAVHVEFDEGDEDGFLKNVMEKFQDPANTILCILDNFDGNSLKAAELLFKNGFKEAYAIRAGVMGKNGWLAIQDTLLPPSIHMKKKKKKKKKGEVSQLGINGGVSQQNENKDDTSSSAVPPLEERKRVDNGHLNMSVKSTLPMKLDSRSPYPCYPDLKPPSSPTPSKP